MRLRIVPTDEIHPHEIADPFRQQRIEARLRADGVLRDPLMVGTVPDLEGYLLLDGTNRRGALAALDLPRALAQLVDYGDPHAVELHTWCHAVAASADELLRLAVGISGLTAAPLTPLEPSGVLHQPDTFALVLDRERQYAIKRAGERSLSRFEQLQRFVLGYEDRMARVDCDPDDVERRAQMLARATQGPRTLVAYPPFTRSQVVAIAVRGTLIPAGITRHVVLAGRVLRVNLPLALLSGNEQLEEANARLQQHLSSLHPRFYAEPTILFDS